MVERTPILNFFTHLILFFGFLVAVGPLAVVVLAVGVLAGVVFAVVVLAAVGVAVVVLEPAT